MKNSVVIYLCALFTTIVFAQETPKPNYRQAARFSPENIAKMVHSTTVNPNWLQNGNRFWYQYKTASEGSKYYLVDADKKTKTPLFDNVKMAKWLSEITKDPYEAKHLPRFNFTFTKDEKAIRFYVTSNEEVDAKEDDAKKDDKKKKGTPKKEKKIYHFEYTLGGNGLKVLDNEKAPEEKWKQWANIAPDSSIVLFSKHNNIYWMDKANFLKAVKNEKDSTIVENQWTKDGVEDFSYGGGSFGKTDKEKIKEKDDKKYLGGFWTHDSKKFVTTRTDSRHIEDLWVIHATKSGRPELETYKYHMAGEQEFYKEEMLVFDMASKSKMEIKLDSTIQQSISIYRFPRKKSSRRDEHNPTLLLSKKGKIYFNTVSRDRKRLDVHVADIATGEVKTIIKEHSNVYIENRGKSIVLFNNEQEILFWAEKDGWGHFYLYDANGNLKNQVTNGPFHVDSFEGIDEKSRTLYFSANGIPKDEDPYYLHLYKINLNGSGLTALNPGDFNSSIEMADSNQYFVSNFSRVNTVPKSELRDSNGKLVMKLEEADLSQLFAAGYQFPEPFKVKADDGITDIYGVMYKPYDFDSIKKYPIIEYVYPGPQTEAVNKSFSVSMDRTDRLAQVGFIVITLGNRGGHPDRSKWYHTFGYGNLRDYGLADKKYVAEQLADKHAFIDIEKVGIFGHSGGGFMSTAAMLVYPDFFKVAISSAGNHDNTVYNSWWSETHHGIKEEADEKGNIKYKYLIDKNQTLAQNLKGKILLATGDVDNNVHPTGTIRMVNAFIKANKRFDFMLFPGSRHGFSDREYWFWKNADYFSKHLLGVENTDVDMIEMNRDKPLKN
ncbi:S9 family peptidase [Polaribacter gangjinensis]|uniref:S9 family peptidase n=1 Tax=Polaribacter gangjinensis TaxID=574710 RepID=A0A2S7WCZ0_9FLAO|nr:DPP IV N-terminal domain-containing protein [Polaribacter gangjinensis]PQJ75132.1 S9 family peptidase [Polaribacter gangjinensis]